MDSRFCTWLNRHMSKDHWRITTAAIQLEMERIAGLLEKSVHFHSRTSAPHTVRERHQAGCADSAPSSTRKDRALESVTPL